MRTLEVERIKHLGLVTVHGRQVFGATQNNDTTGAAGTVAAASMIDRHVMPKRRIQYGNALFNLKRLADILKSYDRHENDTPVSPFTLLYKRFKIMTGDAERGSPKKRSERQLREAFWGRSAAAGPVIVLNLPASPTR
jgi:hypothetical protein